MSICCSLYWTSVCFHGAVAKVHAIEISLRQCSTPLRPSSSWLTLDLSKSEKFNKFVDFLLVSLEYLFILT